MFVHEQGMRMAHYSLSPTLRGVRDKILSSHNTAAISQQGGCQQCPKVEVGWPPCMGRLPHAEEICSRLCLHLDWLNG